MQRICNGHGTRSARFVAEQMTKLDELWRQRRAQFVAFLRIKGHCVVPDKWEPDVSLGGWVKCMQSIASCQVERTHQWRNLELFEKLMSQFVWKVWNADESKSKWNKQFEKLVGIERKMGHCHANASKTCRISRVFGFHAAEKSINPQKR
jgi:hypothetical protein